MKMAIFQVRTWLSRRFSSVSSQTLRVCVVGSGPAGFYTAEKMLKAHQGAQVDIIDRLPTPFGLVRSGVAPDHPETKGNVALDVARILLRPATELATTDIASHALAALEESSIRKVYLVGRRGPVQAACTAKELREVLGIKDLYIQIQEADLLKTPEDEEEIKNNRIQRRVYELLSKAATTGHSYPRSGQRELHFVFFRKPDRFLDSDERRGHVSGVHFEETVLKGVVPNIRGRVRHNTSEDPTRLEEGLYVCGWLKRGPTGIIATNLYCAEETVASILEDLDKGVLATKSISPKPGREGLLHLLDNRNVRFVPFNGWEKIDSTERRVGSLKKKPREKLATWEELLKAATE